MATIPNENIIEIVSPASKTPLNTNFTNIKNFINTNLNNVTNTSDLNKPVSTAQQEALDLKTRSATIKIAASNSTDNSKASADYICDGIADDVQINAAITSLTTTGGCIELSEGTFVGSVLINTSNIWLKGQGISTILDGDIIVANGIIAIISDFKITGGDYDGILNTTGGNLKIFNCDIGNARNYDGIFNEGDLIIYGNTITTIQSNANIKPSTALAIADINNIDVVNIDIT